MALLTPKPWYARPMKYAVAVASLVATLPLALLGACVGNDPALGTTPATGDDAATTTTTDAPGDVDSAPAPSADDAGCVADIPGNLVENGSFTTGTAPWSSTNLATIAISDGGGVDCRSAYGVLTTNGDWEAVDYNVTIPDDANSVADAGVMVSFGAYVRSLDTNSDAIRISLGQYNEPNAPESAGMADFVPPGRWVKAEGTMQVARGGQATLRISSPTSRVVGIDNAWIVVR